MSSFIASSSSAEFHSWSVGLRRVGEREVYRLCPPDSHFVAFDVERDRVASLEAENPAHRSGIVA